MEIFLAIVTLLLAAFVFFSLLYFIFGRVVEPAYMLIFNRPVYVHFYPFPKTIRPSHKAILQKEFSFYRKLSPARRGYFRHRVHNFINNYHFVGRDGLQVTEEMKVRIAATAIMLTFGMRRYLNESFETIILYPDIFESRDGDYHKGEFNPAAKAVVFSWKHFLEGIAFEDDNINLGLHEFTHAMHFECTTRTNIGASSLLYSDMFDKIRRYITEEGTRSKVTSAGYFRNYAYTNQYEFIAVALEYFFESPGEFRQKLPELYEMVKLMINYREG